MKKEDKMSFEPVEREKPRTKVVYREGTAGAIYGLGIFGAWFYFFSHVTTFWAGVLAFFKGIFWPAFMVYGLLGYLKL